MPRKSKKSAKKLDIFKANRFDPSALATNRAGALAAGQKSRLTIRLASMAFSSIASVAFGILWLYLAVIAVPKQTIVDHWLGLIIAVLSFLLGVIWIVDGVRNLFKDSSSLLRDILGGEVVVAEGPARKEYDDHHYASLWHRLFNSIWFFSVDQRVQHIEAFKGTHFYVLDGQRFIVSQKGYVALTEGPSYRLYYVPRSKRLVNIEAVPGEANA
ncbi:MAG: hypothetical protein AB8I69_12480 [Anaerolineae bacterium]|jgi:hypothetical protein